MLRGDSTATYWPGLELPGARDPPSVGGFFLPSYFTRYLDSSRLEDVARRFLPSVALRQTVNHDLDSES